MSVTQDELNSFHRFATERLSTSEAELSIDDLVIEWDSQRNRDQINAAIREGLADIDRQSPPLDERMTPGASKIDPYLFMSVLFSSPPEI